MKTHSEMVESLFKRRDAYMSRAKHRKQMLIRFGVPAVCIAVVASLGLTLVRFNKNTELFHSPNAVLSHGTSPTLSFSASSVISSDGQTDLQAGINSLTSTSPSVSSKPSQSKPHSVVTDVSVPNLVDSSVSSKPNSVNSSIYDQLEESPKPTVSGPLSNGGNSSVSKPSKAPCQLLQMEYNNFDSLISDLRDLNGLQGDKDSINVFVPEPVYKHPESSASPNEPTNPPDVDAPEADPPTLGDADVEEDLPSEEADKKPDPNAPFANATTQEELEQKEIYYAMFKSGSFYIPSMKRGNSTYILRNIEVSKQGICYYYRNRKGVNDPQKAYDLMIRNPLYSDDALREYEETPASKRYASITVEGVEYIFVREDDTDTRFKIYYCVDKVNGYWCSAEYYGSSDFEQLKRAVYYLNLEIYYWK